MERKFGTKLLQFGFTIESVFHFKVPSHLLCRDRRYIFRAVHLTNYEHHDRYQSGLELLEKTISSLCNDMLVFRNEQEAPWEEVSKPNYGVEQPWPRPA